MARVLAVNNIVKADTVCYCQNQVGQFTCHYKVTSVGTPPANDADFALSFENAVAAQMISLMSADAEFLGVRCQILNPPMYQAQISTTLAGPGSAPGTTAPKQAAALMSWKTLFAGRHGRGRVYMPFVPGGFITTGGELLLGAAVQYEVLAVILQGFSLVTAGGRTAIVQLVVYDRLAAIGTQVVDHHVGTSIATQIRRSDFRRTNPRPF